MESPPPPKWNGKDVEMKGKKRRERRSGKKREREKKTRERFMAEMFHDDSLKSEQRLFFSFLSFPPVETQPSILQFKSL